MDAAYASSSDHASRRLSTSAGVGVVAQVNRASERDAPTAPTLNDLVSPASPGTERAPSSPSPPTPPKTPRLPRAAAAAPPAHVSTGVASTSSHSAAASEASSSLYLGASCEMILNEFFSALSPDGAAIQFSTYQRLHTCLFRALRCQFDEKVALAVAEGDWAADSQGRGSMGRDQLYASLASLAAKCVLPASGDEATAELLATLYSLLCDDHERSSGRPALRHWRNVPLGGALQAIARIRRSAAPAPAPAPLPAAALSPLAPRPLRAGPVAAASERASEGEEKEEESGGSRRRGRRSWSSDSSLALRRFAAANAYARRRHSAGSLPDAPSDTRQTRGLCPALGA
eukprot:tig00021293_g20006.t1